MQELTAHSEVGRITSLLLKNIETGFVNQPYIDQEWESLNFLAAPDFDRANAEFDSFEQILSKSGTRIYHLPASDEVTLDSVYCRDAAITTNYGMILCRMGKSKRQNEPEEERRLFEQEGIKILGKITAPGTLEGGDVAWLDEKTLAVGHTYRTNHEGINQLKRLLEPHGIEVLVVEMPHYKGESDVFHLMSVLSPVDYKKAVVYSPLMPIYFREELINRGYALIEVPDEEFETIGCNVLAIAPGECVIVKGNPVTKARLEAAGCTVHEYKGAEISIKGGGGPTCLTRPILRERNA
ncbi:MAG: arginine deiminase family protein [Cyclobacteriaceae bacterium]